MEYLLERSKVQGAFLLGTLRNNYDQNYYWGVATSKFQLKIYLSITQKSATPRESITRGFVKPYW
jgi:hypothetical protein